MEISVNPEAKVISLMGNVRLPQAELITLMRIVCLPYLDEFKLVGASRNAS